MTAMLSLKLIDLTACLKENGLVIIHPIYWKRINGKMTPILTVAKAKSLAGQGETQSVHRTAMQ